MLLQSKLIRNALQFWAATRLIERPWVICNDNPLDLKPCDQPDNPWPDQIPVTPVMDTQLDELAIAGVLKPLRSKILCELSRMVYSGDRKYWTEIYFTTIILLCNFENMIADLLDYAERHGLEVCAVISISKSDADFVAVSANWETFTIRGVHSCMQNITRILSLCLRRLKSFLD